MPSPYALFQQLPALRFDVPELNEAYATVRARVEPLCATRGEDRLRCISLTSRPDAVDPLVDGLRSQFDSSGKKRYREAEFSVFNPQFADTYFAEIHASLPFATGRMRLMVLPPLTVYGLHRDGTRRAHVALATNEGCRLAFATGETFHVPADGAVYVADTKQEHTAYNAGAAERVHLAISMADTEDA